MRTSLILLTIIVVQITAAQHPSLFSKPLPQDVKRTPATTQHLPKMLSEVEGINQAWVKDYQRRTREYLLKTKKVSPAKLPSVPHQSVQSASGAPAHALSLAPASDMIQQVPFASKNNTIELTVNNTTDLTVSDIGVEVTDRPLWLMFSSKSFHIGPLAGKEQKTATLTFSVDKMAPVGQEQLVTVAVKSPSGQVWTKQIRIKVSPPEKFELFQNYPNPFNPTTTISYQLPSDSKVSLKIYDILGREVMTVVDGLETAGYHQEMFDASRLASGAYIYRIVYADPAGKQASAQKRMVLIK
jgi:hypothetical protein